MAVGETTIIPILYCYLYSRTDIITYYYIIYINIVTRRWDFNDAPKPFKLDSLYARTLRLRVAH